MFFILSKILYFIFSPLSWILAFIIAGMFLKNSTKKKKFLITGLLLLVLFSNPFLLNTVMHAWEIPARKINEIQKPYEVGVLMGGSMRYYNTEMERIVFGQGADRLLKCVELYKEKRIKKILLTGGSGLLLMQQYKEAELLKNLILKMNIPEQDIIIENQSKNTYENAKMSSEILKKDFPEKNILLITSAFHMRRSLACFAKQGIAADPFSVDERSGTGQYTPDKIIIPDAEYLMQWDVLFHEWIGCVSYKVAGYL
ncbi:MAG: YdcF family protein [Bacteroidia bacterium]